MAFDGHHQAQEKAEIATTSRPDGLILGTVHLDEDGASLVSFAWEGLSFMLPARTMTPITSADVGQTVVIGFEATEELRPLIMGRLAGSALPEGTSVHEVKARDRLILSCGQASITLTKEGKILLNGRYVSSRSRGVNRISGGSVQIN